MKKVFLLIFILLLTGCAFNKKDDFKILTDAITSYQEKLSNNELTDVDKLFSEEISDDNKKLEKAIKEYLNTLNNSLDKVNELYNNEELINSTSLDNLKDLKKLNSLYDDKIEVIKSLKEEFNNLNNQESYLKELNEKQIKFFKEKLSTIKYDSYLNNLNNIEYSINNSKKIIEFLNNKKYELKEEVIFNKRNNYNEFKEMMDKLTDEYLFKEIKYNIVKDKTGPVINASNTSVNVGTKYDLESKISCVDAVDDKVKCEINGKYDTSKIGTYKVTIKAKDTSKNESSKTITITVKAKQVNKKPYYIEVIRNQNIVIVYGLDGNNEYKKVVKVFTVSVGKGNNTPTGTFTTTAGKRWGWLKGGVYGQYSTRITGSILFHSVPYYKKDASTLEWEEYNKLGTKASAGCVRMTVRDVKWIYDNCPVGTKVKIYDGNIPSGITKPTVPKIPADSPNKGWDPTDPDKNNPWKK